MISDHVPANIFVLPIKSKSFSLTRCYIRRVGNGVYRVWTTFHVQYIDAGRMFLCWHGSSQYDSK